KILLENRDKVEAMTDALLEWETIDADQIDDIMAGKPPRPPKPAASSQPPQPPQTPTAPAATTPTQPAQET
ncbi:MAG TPA: cell division protein FtsH, partial [Gallionellaceae bacterium]|nr:cell division protein FtsH [Gallionellaceae bacterium]